MRTQLALDKSKNLVEVAALCPYCHTKMVMFQQNIICSNCGHMLTTDDCSCYDCSKLRNLKRKTKDYFDQVVPVTINEPHRALVLLLLELLPNNNGVFQLDTLFEKPLFFNNRIVTEKLLLEPLIQNCILVPIKPYDGIELFKEEFIKIDYREASFRLNVTNLSDKKMFDKQTTQSVNLLFETDTLISSFTRHLDNLSIPYNSEVLLTKLNQLLILYRPYLHWLDFTNSVLSTIAELERLLVRCQLQRTEAVDIALMDFERVLEFAKKRKSYPITAPTYTKHLPTTKGIEIWCVDFLGMSISDFFNRIPTKHFF